MVSHPYLETLALFSVTILALAVCLTLFELVTSYDDWEEIKSGNLSVAMAIGGKIFGICNIFRFSITNHDSLIQSVIWAGYGFILLILSYFIFEFLTPRFKIDQEIKKNNLAVGLLSLSVSVSISYVIGASIG